MNTNIEPIELPAIELPVTENPEQNSKPVVDVEGKGAPVVGEPESVAGPEAEPETYPAEHVKELRAEAAAQRVKAKRTDAANERLATLYASSDGRLISASELAYSDALLGDDGLVDAGKVTAAVSELLAIKPYLASIRPTTPIAQGARITEPAPVGLFDLIRSRS